MATPGAGSNNSRPKSAALNLGQISIQHYIELLLHRKWLIVATCLVVTAVTVVAVSQLPNVYRSETLILVDPQKVPDSYVKATVTGDVRNRLSTLEQQILSATRLQKIIDNLKLYTEERKSMSREEILGTMRRDITISLVSDFGRADTLQAFKIAYTGKNPRLVARVVSEISSQFIEENLKARTEQATGTTEFLQSQLEDTRKELQTQESKLSAFRMKHIGEMPEQESANLQILGHLQSQLHLAGEAVARAEQQRSLAQAMISQSSPVVDFDDGDARVSPAGGEARETKPAGPAAQPVTVKAKMVAELNDKLKRGYTERHPDIRKLRSQIAAEDAKEPAAVQVSEVKPPAPPDAQSAVLNPPETVVARRRVTPQSSNPVLVTQLKALDSEIAKQKEEQQRLNKQIAGYQTKLEAIPVRQQEAAELVRDYEISKAHYSQLLDKQLSAETATQLEIRQKGEKFKILDPPQVPEKPYKPDRIVLDAGGFVAGLVLGVILALASEIFGMCITTADQAADASGIAVLEVIPVIETPFDLRRRKKRMWATVSAALATVLACSVVLFFYRYRG